MGMIRFKDTSNMLTSLGCKCGVEESLSYSKANILDTLDPYRL